MSNPDAPAMGQYAIVFGASVISVMIAVWAGVFHSKNVDGPGRLDERIPVSRVWFMFMLGLFASVLPSTIHDSVTQEAAGAATQPATMPSMQVALLTVAGASLVGVVLVVANLLARPTGINRLGISSAEIAKAPLQGLIAILITVPLVFLGALLTQALWSAIQLEHPAAHPLLRMMQQDSNRLLWQTIIISASIIAPVSEELLFRGTLQTAFVYSFSRILNKPITEPGKPNLYARWGGIFAASLLFALFHGEVWMMPPIFLLSLALGYLYERTGNLWSCILLHAGFNVTNLILWRYSLH